MIGGAWAFLVVAAVFAVGNWISRATDNRPLEYVTKPVTTLALVGLALAVDPADGGQRAWFVAAVAFGLVGDVFLMLPDERRFFPLGLAAFLVGHVLYVVGFVDAGLEATGVVVGLALAVVAVAMVGVRILRAVSTREPALRAPVVAYLLVISAMVVAAFGSTEALAVVGALFFYGSDSLIGWSKFVQDLPWGPVAIMVTYHVGQTLLVLSLV